MKRILNIITTITIAFFICITNSYAYDKVDDTSKKIYDYGDLLTESQEVYLKGLIDEYISTYNYDMVIVTKRDYSASTSSMMNYADDFYDYNNFGIGDTKDGILLFLNVDSLGPIVWISTTGKAILMYDDARINSLKNSMSAVKNNGNGAIVESFIKNASLYAEKGIPASNRNAYIDENGNYKIRRTYPFLRNIIIAGVGSTIILVILLAKNKMIKHATLAREYLDKNSVNISLKRDVFLTTHTSKINISSSSSGGGGGSSTHSGSSGSSHGGGGGRL